MIFATIVDTARLKGMTLTLELLSATWTAFVSRIIAVPDEGTSQIEVPVKPVCP
jgi:hypothetical protein